MTIDTLKISKELIEAGLSQKVSEKLATRFKQNDENYLSKNGFKKGLATKSDIKQLEIATKNDIKQLEITTKNDIKQLELATKAEIANSKYTIIVWNVGMLMIRFLKIYLKFIAYITTID